MLLLILVACEELLLLGVEQPDDVSALQDALLVVSVVHEEGDLPAGAGVEHIYLWRGKLDHLR